MTKAPCFVAEIDVTLAPKLKQDLESQGFELSQPTYTLFQAKKKGVSCTLYESGKLTVQGKDKHDFITYYLEPEVLGQLTYSYPEADADFTSRIGVDEAGKGDVFGPLCICALYADGDAIRTLIKSGIRDSKRISDPVILKYAEKIKKTCKHSLVTIFPKKYNELYEKFHNLNHLLAWGHSAAIEKLTQEVDCRDVIIDQFAAEHVVETALERKGVEVNLTQRHRGEEDVVVAAASILARAAFVEGIEKLGKEYNQKLPKGASPAVTEALRAFIRSHGKEMLQMVGKLHFKTIQELI